MPCPAVLVRAGVATLAIVTGCFSPDEDDSGIGADTDGTSGTGSATADATDSESDPTPGSQSASDPSAETSATDAEASAEDPDSESGDSATTDTGPSPVCGDGMPAEDEFCPPAGPTTFDVGVDAFDVVLADIDGTALDIATANRSSGTVSVLLGDGAGGFGDAVGYTVLGEPVRIRAADGDGDGDLDFVTGPGDISTLVNEGDGSLTRYDSVDVGAGSGFSEDVHAELNVIQANGSGGLDILLTAEYDSNLAPGYTNTGWTFGPPVATGAGNEGATGLVATEFAFDGDGFVDAVGVGQYSETADILLGNGNGTFDVLPGPEVCPSAEYEGARFVDAADLDNDGNTDLLITCMVGDFTVHLGEDDGTFEPAVRITRAGAQKLAVGDLDGDGDLDVGASSTSQLDLAIYLNDGTGVLAEPVLLAVEEPTNTIAFGDLDDDGALDVVTAYDAGAGGRVAVFLSDP